MLLISYWLRLVKRFVNIFIYIYTCVCMCFSAIYQKKNNHSIHIVSHENVHCTNDAADPMISSNPKFRLFLWIYSLQCCWLPFSFISTWLVGMFSSSRPFSSFLKFLRKHTSKSALKKLSFFFHLIVFIHLFIYSNCFVLIQCWLTQTYSQGIRNISPNISHCTTQCYKRRRNTSRELFTHLNFTCKDHILISTRYNIYVHSVL